ncbi:MAG: hypothetical protein M0P31_10845 [Solirubrobacteraceae bacterium]|nr:hypothetical protein [Solirubrobacteraceae bacterium]
MHDTDVHERRFRRAGLPLLIEDYSAREDVFNRAFPLLALVFVVELLGALDLDWSWVANVAAVAGAVGVALVAVAAVNRMRGRPALTVPEDLGWPELAAFVVVPALLPLVFNGQTTSALVTAAVNLGVLALVALGYGLALGSILVWASRRLVHQLAATVGLLARAVPLLLLFAIVLFVNAEMWQVFAPMSGGSLVAIGLLLAVVALAFLAVRLPREVRELERAAAEDPRVAAAPPLRRSQRLNVGMVLLVGHGLQVLVVSVAITGFFVLFGMLAIDEDVVAAWTAEGGGRVLLGLDTTIAGVPVRLTEELLRVSAAIGGLSGLYFAISVLTDSAYREEFLDELTDEMRETFVVRADYLALRAAEGSGADGS